MNKISKVASEFFYKFKVTWLTI